MTNHKMPRRRFLAGAASSAIASVLLHQTASRAANPPNIVFFLSDDQNYRTMSSYGGKVIATPNMDRIANEGAMFLNAFVTNSLCCPSRASFMTGLYSHTHGVKRNNALSSSQKVFTDYLRAAGYQTCFIGKWHMDGTPPQFDFWLGFSGQGDYENPKLLDFNGELVQQTGHMSDLLGDKAITYLKQYRQGPFCLFVWDKAPHRPWTPAPRYENALTDVTIPEPPTFNTDYSGKPEAVRNTDMRVETAKPPKTFQEWMKDYYRTLLSWDENIGRVLNTLDELGLTEDTIVIHSSDNGFFMGEQHFFDKRLMYEPSIRVPLVFRYPRMVKPGLKISEMVLNVDVAPTLLDIVGLSVPDEMHGTSFKSLLEQQTVPWRSSFLYEYYDYPASHKVKPHRGVRTQQWKYIHFFEEPQEFELYALNFDPDETNNLVANPYYNDVVAEMRRELERLRRETNDPDLVM
ncbi:MAG TPA: sulfatase [Oscillatoriaceae cyanobacterium M33_DOE_052]|nr:sulfatase [Oscillatoriaceae cyanobacterium M33_DOE_052]